MCIINSFYVYGYGLPRAGWKNPVSPSLRVGINTAKSFTSPCSVSATVGPPQKNWQTGVQKPNAQRAEVRGNSHGEAKPLETAEMGKATKMGRFYMLG